MARLSGGDGSDTFVFEDLTSWDRIKDFEQGSDQIDLSAVTSLSTLADVTAALDVLRGDLHIIISPTSRIILIESAGLTLSETDFIF